MSTGKKVLNVFGIIFALPVNTVLVIILMVAPLLFSLIAFIQPENLVDTVTKVDTSDVVSEMLQAPEGETLPKEIEQISVLLESDVFNELQELYMTDIANTFLGGKGDMEFTPEKIMEIVDANMDELVEIYKELDPQSVEVPVEELKIEIRDALDELSEEIAEALPAPEEVKTQMVEQSEEMKMALEIIEQRETIKWGLVGVIVVLAIVVFVLRLFGFRGFRWLGVDLIIAAVISGGMCGLLKGSTILLADFVADNQLASNLLSMITSDFATGMIIRTGIMLVCGIGLLVAFIYIRKAQKRKAATVTPVAAQETPTLAEE
ncbi:MAG: hypothetical protein IJB47_03665 [Oscillospiraceae bacterium]|nr:hypothetical protein [Oscillospiraceae bacterium]